MVPSDSPTSDIAYDSVFYMALGPGGMERMVIYPALMWLAGFGGHLLTERETQKKPFVFVKAGFVLRKVYEYDACHIYA
jgi:hypothetical protein